MAVEFTCRECGAVLTVDAPAGTSFICPQCKKQQVVPDQSTGMGAKGDGPGGVLIVNERDWHGVVRAALPWALSLAMHGALLLMMALAVWATAVQESSPNTDPREQIIIPTAVVGSTPGGSLHPGPSDDTLAPAQNLHEEGGTGFSSANEVGFGTDSGGAAGGLDLIGSTGGEVGRLAAAVGGVGEGIGAGAGGPLAPFGPVATGGGHGPPSRFMGISGTGLYVVYIIDRSGSMVGTIDYVKKELKRSIEQLGPEQLFHVLFYNVGEPVEFNAAQPGEPPLYRLNYATDQVKAKAFTFIDSIVATGQTNPLEAFRRAFALKPRPHVIYFLTDGLFGEHVADELLKINPGQLTKIHAIAFSNRAAETLLKRIASENGGTYRYVDPEAKPSR